MPNEFFPMTNQELQARNFINRSELQTLSRLQKEKFQHNVMLARIRFMITAGILHLRCITTTLILCNSTSRIWHDGRDWKLRAMNHDH